MVEAASKSYPVQTSCLCITSLMSLSQLRLWLVARGSVKVYPVQTSCLCITSLMSLSQLHLWLVAMCFDNNQGREQAASRTMYAKLMRCEMKAGDDDFERGAGHSAPLQSRVYAEGEECHSFKDLRVSEDQPHASTRYDQNGKMDLLVQKHHSSGIQTDWDRTPRLRRRARVVVLSEERQSCS
jgi:hypothetical protein